MDLKDPRLIVILEAHSTTAERAWNRRQNRDRCLPAPECVADISSRESTPAVDQPGSQIRLTFNHKPKNIERGFVFGSDPQLCDVFLGERGAGFSGQQFCITFNERGEILFKNTSRKEAQVDYNGEKPPRRNQFTWILFNTYENIKITMGKHNDLIFKVMWPDHENCTAEYEAHRGTYFKERRNALPPLSQLGMESQQTTAVPTAQHSPKREPLYLLKEELGRGAFGTVHKAVDVSKGDMYAAKKFYRGDWKKEVDILMNVSHDNIVKFVNFSDEQNPLLVMEYLPLGNLACQDVISKEETIQILYQGLQALEHLHSYSPPLAHRDIKPENILIQSRMPLSIKLADFGLANNDSSVLETFCGSIEYAAPEIWGHRYYSAMVDIWSLGVVVLEYVYGLPEPTSERKGELWCLDIVKAAENGEDGDILMDLISTKMLRMNDQDRYTASDCLGEVYRLGFHEIQTVDVGCTTPTGNMAGRDEFTRSQSLIAQTLQHAPSNRDRSPRLYDIGGTSPLKRDFRDGIHFRSPLDDVRGKRKSKRPRVSVSFEAGEGPSTPSKRKGHNPAAQSRQIPRLDLNAGPLATDVASLTQAVESIPRAARITRKVTQKFTQNRARSPLGRGSAPAAEVSPRGLEAPSSKRNIHGNVINMLAGTQGGGNLDGANEGIAKVTVFDGQFIEITGFHRPVLVRKSDFRINASHITKLAGLSKHVLENLRTKLHPAEYDILQGGTKRQGTYVNFDVGIRLCQKYGLPELEKRLYSLKHPSKSPVPRDSRNAPLELTDPPPPPAQSGKYEVWDSRPQLSELTEVEPELRPSSWKTASNYGSLGDLFAPK